MSDLAQQVIKNAREQQSDFSQRRAAVVRVCGEEHTATGHGTANVYLTLDNDMAYISEYKFKLVFGTGGDGSGTPQGADVIRGTNTWASADAFIAQYPIGTALDTDNTWGCQCWDYANAFWLGQVNRRCETGDSTARGIWVNRRAVNAGSEFDLITNWSDLKKGDWIIWGNGTYGHVAMAAGAPNGDNIQCYGQNQGGIPWPSGGAAVNLATRSRSGFLGAFRYKNWN